MGECTISLPKFHPKQQVVFDSKATDILFAGDTRAGKSFYIRKCYILFCAQIPGLQTDIFRLHMDDVIKENMEGETSFPVLLNAWEKEGLCKINQCEITFWNDSKIYLEHCADDVVMLKHRGIPRHVRTFAESSQILEHRLRALTGWVTMSEEMKSRVPDKWKGLFPKVYHVTNAIGVSAGYYRREYVDKRTPMSIERVGQFDRQYIPAFLDDNPSEDPDQTKARIAEAFPDEQTQKALINEDKSGISNWHAGGGEFFPEYDRRKHVVVDFSPPQHWSRFRCFDWGTADPFYVGWFAVSDGEPFHDNEKRQRWFPRGSLILYQEWNGADSRDPSKGIRLRNEEMALGILSRSEINFQNVPTLTDSRPFQDGGGETIALVFQRNGVILSKGDTSRVTGWSQMRGRLKGIEYDTNRLGADGKPVRLPLLYICDSCKFAQDYIRALPRHPSESRKEDAAEDGEATHSCDTIRLACMAHTIIKEKSEPFESRIKKQVELSRPTMKRILKSNGENYL